MTIKAKKFIITDTETVGLQPENYVYDLGYTICDKRGNIELERNFLIRDIVTDADKMMGAYYAKKIFSFYIPALDANTIKLYSWSDAIAIMQADIMAHDVDVFAAYNARFDCGALRATAQLMGTGKIMPKPVDLLCLWLFACTALLNRPTYHRMARHHGWVSEADNLRTTAEHTHRYLTGNPDFIESHTALDDAQIETGIFAAAMRQKKKIPYNDLKTMPWKIAQEVV